MSSNMYGFTCQFPWDRRCYAVQIVVEGTDTDEGDSSVERATARWPADDATQRAAVELALREVGAPPAPGRLEVWSVHGEWLQTDPWTDSTWKPPVPSDEIIFRAIARSEVQDIKWGWDT